MKVSQLALQFLVTQLCGIDARVFSHRNLLRTRSPSIYPKRPAFPLGVRAPRRWLHAPLFRRRSRGVIFLLDRRMTQTKGGADCGCVDALLAPDGFALRYRV